MNFHTVAKFGATAGARHHSVALLMLVDMKKRKLEMT
jgi:hypothetical protein